MTAEASGLDAGRKIADLRRLQDGWRNGDGIAFDADYLAWLSETFSRMYPSDAPMPTICPTTYGFVSTEWSFPDVEVSLEIAPETRQGNLVWASVVTGKSGETVIDMTKPEGWARLVKHISHCV